MPSKLKRINLTVPVEVYRALERCKDHYAWNNDAGMAMLLIVWQLRELGYLSRPSDAHVDTV